MILVIETGRLGNQLFQYHAINKLFTDEKKVYFGFQDLGKFIYGKKNYFIKKNKIIDYLEVLLLFLVNVRVFSELKEINVKGKYNTIQKKGFFENIKVVKTIYFQSNTIFNDKFHLDLKIASNVAKIAKNKLNQGLKKISLQDINLQKSNLVFIHVRRGDYLDFGVGIENKTPALDDSFYLSALERQKQSLDNPIFVVLSDDYQYSKSLFSNVKNLIILKNEVAIDLCIMSMCDHGILSASSLSWWGAFYSKNLSKRGDNVYIAPRYWMGHRSKDWIPANMEFNWIAYY